MDDQAPGSQLRSHVKPAARSWRPERCERIALVLQGGGALGAYQAGVYQALDEAGIAPDWVSGVSIGAINAAIIAGNPPERRLAQLRKFWERITERKIWPFTPDGDIYRKARNALSCSRRIASVCSFGRSARRMRTSVIETPKFCISVFTCVRIAAMIRSRSADSTSSTAAAKLRRPNCSL